MKETMTLAMIARVCGGSLSPTSAAARVAKGAAIDSRRLAKREVFAALPGAHYDGHDFVKDAAAAGACAVLVARRQDVDVPQIVVEDPQRALHDWAAAHRAAFNGWVAAISGSNGKTTGKEMLAAVAAAHFGAKAVRCTQGNYNNHLGVPLTLLSLTAGDKILIAEAGMDKAGELTQLAALLKPHLVVLLNAQRAHIGNFSSLTAVAEAKAELLSGLPEDGVAVLNADDAHFSLWCERAAGRRVVSFSTRATTEATLNVVSLTDGIQVGETPIKLAVPGKHNQVNAAAAAAAATVLELPVEAVATGLQKFRGVAGRLQRIARRDKNILFDDSYNANPDSAAAAVAVLREQAGSRPAVLVMGDMLALGETSAAEHAALLTLCDRDGVMVLGTGEAMGEAIPADSPHRYFAEKAALVNHLREWMARETLCVLVKGSRGMRMDEVVRDLAEATT